ncbi:MAG: hypothetical protein K0U79_00285 [Gammaproteobacteria bacterium]|nr:hypothetical protein [Gammaproteobacteria bacterium]
MSIDKGAMAVSMPKRTSQEGKNAPRRGLCKLSAPYSDWGCAAPISANYKSVFETILGLLVQQGIFLSIPMPVSITDIPSVIDKKAGTRNCCVELGNAVKTPAGGEAMQFKHIHRHDVLHS